jgi:hypothetical protein
MAVVMLPRGGNYLDSLAEIHFARGNRREALNWPRLAMNHLDGWSRPDDDEAIRALQDGAVPKMRSLPAAPMESAPPHP